MVGKYAQGEPDSQRPSPRCPEPNAAAAADPRRLRALPPGSPGDAGLAEDAGVLRRHGPALPALGGGGRGAAVRGTGRVSSARLRAQRATRPGRHGQPLQPKTILESHRAILCFLRWARREGYHVDGRILELKAPRVPDKEPTVYHIAQVRKVLAACNPAVPTEDLVVRILVGSGLRRAEICGLAVLGPDGLSDVMTDSLGRGRVELRVRWDAGAKGRKSRRVPITPKLAAAIKRYEARPRPETDLSQLLINGRGGALSGARDQGDDGSAYAEDGLSSPCARVQAHVRDGRGQAGMELRAPPSGDGSL
jgi:hypothetical protein